MRSDLTLDQVHDVLQDALGWTNSHLHAFQIGPMRDPLVERFLTTYDVEEGDEGVLENDVRLDQVLADVGDVAFYDYDFGDGWDHTIRLEAITAYDDSQPGSMPGARVTDGRRACPPEDCGGVGGYDELLAGLADPSSVEEWIRERLDWLPEGFDPAHFDVAQADAAVQDLLQLSRSTVLPDTLSEPFADLLRRTPWHASFALPQLCLSADLRNLTRPDEQARAHLLRPYLHLLELADGDGIPLTQAGFLKPDVVFALAETLGREKWWGKANREDLTRPVADLRATANTLGLVRKHKGRLVLSPAGRRVAANPDTLWELLTTRLPLGKKPAEQHAGVIALVATAAGRDPHDVLTTLGPAILDQGGWSRSDGDPLSRSAVYDLGRATAELLLVLSRTYASDRVDPELTAPLRALARAALQS